ncbi:MAG: NUDIX domain-containing protein [Proteobacteria bacterium]|nr:NUDIX domain-containing protein [Pseudomonadota bacterium]
MKNIIDKLAWINIKNKRLLVARSKGKDIYYIPGGKREKGENDERALIREIKEELTVSLLSETIRYARSFEAQAHDKPQGTIVKVTCYFANFRGEIRANSEIEEIVWLNYRNREKCSFVTQMIMDWLYTQGMIESKDFTHSFFKAKTQVLKNKSIIEEKLRSLEISIKALENKQIEDSNKEPKSNLSKLRTELNRLKKESELINSNIENLLQQEKINFTQ